MSNFSLSLCQSIGSTATRLLRLAPPVPTSAMLALGSITSCSTRPCIWQSATRSFSCLNRLEQAPVRSADKEQRLARLRERFQERYQNDPVFRQKQLDARRNTYRQPEIRTKVNAYKRVFNQRNYEKNAEAKSLAWANDLGYRRAMTLSRLLSQRAVERYTWRTHVPTQYTDRVDHYCTGCNRNRFLRRWWKEKPEASECSEQPSSDRYMCNQCFANDWPRVVPETYEGTLFNIFRSPELPLYRGRHQERVENQGDKDKKSQKK